ncbi:MAG: PaaI family thioesterase [Saprospiraceae bacterium]
MNQLHFLHRANTSWKMRFYLLWKLPAAWFMGIRVRSCDLEQCVVELPYSWFSQNPFRSTYFAAQCAAAELSTGMLALAHLQERPPISMLVTRIEADFLKKVSETLTLTCSDGAAFRAIIQKAIDSGEAQIFEAQSIGTLPDGLEAAKVRITWSFKMK